MTKTKDGGARVPSTRRAAFVGLGPVAIGAVFLFMGLGSSTGPPILFGLFAIVIGIIGGLTEHSRGLAYERAQRRYPRERATILTEMQSLAPPNEQALGGYSDDDRPFPGLP